MSLPLSLLSLCLLAGSFAACLEKSASPPPSSSATLPIQPSETLALDWRVDLNWEENATRSTCTFILRNQGDQLLGADWILYFSQLPRRIVQAGDSSDGPGSGTPTWLSPAWPSTTPWMAASPPGKVRSTVAPSKAISLFASELLMPPEKAAVQRQEVFGICNS